MMEAEMDEQLGYESYERSDNNNYRNGIKRKRFVAVTENSRLILLKTETAVSSRRLLKNVRKRFPRLTQK